MLDLMDLILNPLNNIPNIIALFKSAISELGSSKKDLKCSSIYNTNSSLENFGASIIILNNSISV